MLWAYLSFTVAWAMFSEGPFRSQRECFLGEWRAARDRIESMVLDFRETICLLTSGRVQGTKKMTEIKNWMKRGRKGEERKTRRRCLESESRVWVERGKWNQPTGGRGLARVAESAYWKGFLPSWLRPASEEVVKRQRWQYVPRDPGRYFDFVPPGFPLAFLPGTETGSYCNLTPPTGLSPSKPRSGVLDCLEPLSGGPDVSYRLSSQHLLELSNRLGLFPPNPSWMPATPGKASTADHFTHQVFTELDLV